MPPPGIRRMCRNFVFLLDLLEPRLRVGNCGKSSGGGVVEDGFFHALLNGGESRQFRRRRRNWRGFGNLMDQGLIFLRDIVAERRGHAAVLAGILTKERSEVEESEMDFPRRFLGAVIRIAVILVPFIQQPHPFKAASTGPSNWKSQMGPHLCRIPSGSSSSGRR